MKVLWFTNTSCSAAKILEKNEFGGGWLFSLENELANRNSMSLFISFYTESDIQPFSVNKTMYYPVFRKDRSSKTKRIWKRILVNRKNDKGYLRQLLKVVKEIRPDVIHIHGTEEDFGILVGHTQIPIVVSLQGILAPNLEKYFSGIPQWIAKKYEKLSSKIIIDTFTNKFKNMGKRAIRERNILKQTKYIIGRTDWDKRVSRILAPHSQYFVVNEILRSEFYGKEWKKTPFIGKIIIVTILGHDLYKGFETIISAAKLLALSSPNFDFEWKVIGLDKNSEIVHIVEKWMKVNIEKLNVKLLGLKRASEITAILSSASIYCQVSHIENSPNSLCEAMLIGKPIIATFVGGTSSMIKNNKEGILIQDGDPYSLAGAINEIVNDPDQANYYAKNAHKRAIKRHDKEEIVSQLLAVYKNILYNEKKNTTSTSTMTNHNE